MKRLTLLICIFLNVIAGCSNDNQKPYDPEELPKNVESHEQKRTTQSMETSTTKDQIAICGQPTKRGKPCKRHVRGGGACWQHK